jgi:hypothetical protein
MNNQEPPTYMYAIKEIDGDGNWSYAGREPLTKEEATERAKQLRQWAKEDNSNHKFRIVRVYLTFD